MENNGAFKRCTLCQKTWQSREDLVRDLSLSVNGYQVCVGAPENGLFLLTHERARCRSTMGIPAGLFKDYYFGPEYSHNRMGKEGCPLYCLNQDILDDCGNECSMAWVRSILQYLRKHQIPQDNELSVPG